MCQVHSTSPTCYVSSHYSIYLQQGEWGWCSACKRPITKVRPSRGSPHRGLVSRQTPEYLCIERSAMSSWGSGAISMMALGWQEIGSLCTSCIGTSAVVTSTHIFSAGTSADMTDSRGRPRPAFSLVIAMPGILDRAIMSLHNRHKKQRLLFFSAQFVWLHRWHCHEAAARAADPSFGISLIEEGDWCMINDRSEELRRALVVASPSKIKEYYSYNQSYILDLWYWRRWWLIHLRREPVGEIHKPMEWLPAVIRFFCFLGHVIRTCSEIIY